MDAPLNSRTVRQKRVVDLLLDGCENADIAKALGISDSTVKEHIKRLCRAHGITGTPHSKRIGLAMKLCAAPVELKSTEARLTPRQLQTVQLVAEGMKNHEIGIRLGTTEHMVKNYLVVIYDITGCWNRLELALWYVNHFGKVL